MDLKSLAIRYRKMSVFGRQTQYQTLESKSDDNGEKSIEESSEKLAYVDRVEIKEEVVDLSLPY